MDVSCHRDSFYYSFFLSLLKKTGKLSVITLGTPYIFHFLVGLWGLLVGLATGLAPGLSDLEYVSGILEDCGER